MERRKSVRVSTRSGKVDGRIVLAADLDVQDLSLSGVRFTCCERIIPQSRINLVIRRDELQVNVTATIVRSSLRGPDPGRCNGGPVYDVAAAFAELQDREKRELERLFGLLGSE